MRWVIWTLFEHAAGTRVRSQDWRRAEGDERQAGAAADGHQYAGRPRWRSNHGLPGSAQKDRGRLAVPRRRLNGQVDRTAGQSLWRCCFDETGNFRIG